MSDIGARWDRVRSDTALASMLVPPPTFATITRREPYLTALSDLLDGVENANGDAALQVYVHVPLCQEKCTFCMYHYSLTDPNARRAVDYASHLTGLIADLVQHRGSLPAAALYVGGGTPSVLTEDQMDLVLSSVTTAFPLERGAGATFEMSPRSATVDKIAVAGRHGVNRFSFGVQSFDAGLLRSVHRGPTDPEHLTSLIAAAFEAGAEDINCDLMVGLINQDTADLVRSVEALARLNVPGITLYRYRPVEGAEDPRQGADAADYIVRCAAMVTDAAAAVKALGYEATRPLDAESVRLIRTEHRDRRRRLAQRAWYRTQHRLDLDHTVIGLGSGALSFSGSHYFRCPHVADFAANLADREVEVLLSNSAEEIALSVVRELYWTGNVDSRAVLNRYGVSLESVMGDELALLCEEGLIAQRDSVFSVEVPAAQWNQAEKLLYPQDWLDQRFAEATG